jgi:hypothetical protein
MARFSTYFTGCCLCALALWNGYLLMTGNGHPRVANTVWETVLLAFGLCTLRLTFRRNAVFTINPGADRPGRTTAAAQSRG